MNCPRCAEPMQMHMLDGHLGREVEVDVCAGCQSLWFDVRENLQLTPGATLSVFRLIGERVGRAGAAGSRPGEVSALQGAAAPHAGHAARDPLRIFPLSQRSRPA